MSRLNIPLHDKRTARHSRRAVWRLIGLGILLALVWVLVFTFFTRASLAKYTPQEATMGIHLLPNSNTWPLLLESTKGVPLLDNSGLTLDQLAASITSQISYYLLPAGQVIVYRGTMSDELERDLKAQNIVIQKPNKHIYVLSDHPVQLSEAKFKQSWFNRLDPRYLGSIVEYNALERVSKSIMVSNNSILIKLNEYQGPVFTEPLPETTVAALELEPNSSHSELIAHLLNTSSELTLNLFQDLDQYGGRVLLGYDTDANQTQFKLEIDRSYNDTELNEIHLSLAGLQNPTVQSKKLPDGTTISEIILETEDIELESTTIGGRTALQSQNLISVSSETKTEFTNTANFLMLGSSTTGNSYVCADNPVGVLYPSNTNNYLADQMAGPFRLISLISNFVEISLDKQGKNIQIRACLP